MAWNLNFLNTFKEQSPYYNMALSIISLFILIFPAFLSAEIMVKLIYLLNLREKSLLYILGIFLLSSVYTLGHFIKVGVETFQKKRKEKLEKKRIEEQIKKEKEEGEKRLHNLTKEEKQILSYYTKNNTRTYESLFRLRGQVVGLLDANLIYQAGYDCNINDWVFEYLKKYPELLKLI